MASVYIGLSHVYLFFVLSSNGQLNMLNDCTGDEGDDVFSRQSIDGGATPAQLYLGHWVGLFALVSLYSKVIKRM